MDVASRAEQVVKGAVEADGLELMHVEYLPRGSGSLLRIYVDKPGGVDVGDCQRLSKHVSVLLDVEDIILHHYLLEVSSPGIERPLFTELDYQRFRDKEVRLEAFEKIDGRRKFTGFIRSLSGGILRLECELQTYQIPFHKIRKANLVCRF